jgi:signal transduction histidine kinase
MGMKQSACRQGRRARTAAALAAVLLSCLPGAAGAQDVQRKVLVLYSTGRDAVIARTAERDLPLLLDNGLDRRLDYHAEYIDAGRFADPVYQEGFHDFLRLKYTGLKFDLIIGMQDVALQFLQRHRSDLFPDTPVVYLARNKVPADLPNATGILAEIDFTRTVTLARAVHPGLKEVFVISGAGSRDQALEGQARAQFQQYDPLVKFTYLSGLRTPDLEDRLAAMPANSIAFYVLVYEDGAGEAFQPLEYLERLTNRANRPVYSWVDSTFGHGVLGGHMQRLEPQIADVAALALRVLKGTPAATIPVTAAARLDVAQMDWRQFRRWGISETRLPAGTEVLFRTPGVWERYRTYIVGAIVVLLGQTTLIVGLLVQAARRKRAEEQVRSGREALRLSSERIRDLGGRLLKAQEDERSRLARELHDDVGQQMALLSMDLQALKMADPGMGAKADTFARDAIARTDSIARSLHDLSHRLHPAKLRVLGLVPALKGLQRELSSAERSRCTISFSHEDVPASLSHDLTLCLFRVAQEALQNAIKHGRARSITMHLQASPSSLAMTIVDDGVGFDVNGAWDRGLGLVSMTERVESIGGAMSIRSSPGAGTSIEVQAPIAAGQAAEAV